MNKKILFIKTGSFSHINRKIAQTLNASFPESDLVVYDIIDDLLKNKLVLIRNAVEFLWEYKHDIMFGHKSFFQLRSSFLITTYLFKKAKNKINSKFSSSDILFSIQTQSQFDLSILNVPHFVYTDHTLRANFLYPGIDYRAYMKSNQYTNLEASIYENASLVFSYSQFVKNSLIQQYNIEESKVFKLGVTPNTYVESSFQKEEYERKIILFVGVNWKRKGGDLLVNAFMEVLKKFPDANLHIVGCTPNIKEHPNIKIFGKIPLDEVSSHYKNASIFCMPATREPFGVVFLEAMTYQLPVIALNSGAAREIISHGQNGFLCKENVEDISSYLIKLLEDSILGASMGKKGKELVEKNFNEKLFCDNLIKSILPYLNLS